MIRTRRARILFWVLFLGMLVLDQIVKAWTRASFAQNGSLSIIPNVFEITLTYNKGVAFGLFQGAGVLLTPIAIGIAIGAFLYSYRRSQESLWTHTAMALLASGALGNLYDRLFLGQVTDMFWFRAINFPVFNVADSCITIAAVLLILKWGKEAIITDQPSSTNGTLPPEGNPTETFQG